MLSFSNMLQTVAQRGLTDFGWNSETLLSLPVAVLQNQSRFDAFFVYRAPLRKKSARAPRPFQWLLLGAQSGQIALWCDCAVQDFISPQQYPPGCEIDLFAHKPPAARKVACMQARLQELYEQVRTFAFSSSLHPAQEKLLKEYRELFMRVAYPGHLPFYAALSPGFFRWLGLTMPAPASSGPTAEEPPGTCDTHAQDDTHALCDKLEALRELFEQKIAKDKHKEHLFDQLHRELQQYKNGLADSFVLPLLRDLIQLADGVRKNAAFYRAQSPVDANLFERLLRMYEGVETDLADVLYRYGAEPFSQPGDEVNTTKQMIVSTVPTTDPALDKTVAVRHVPGWTKDGRMIRPERISAYVYGGHTSK